MLQRQRREGNSLKKARGLLKKGFGVLHKMFRSFMQNAEAFFS
jgi:hypothetical protein